MIVRKNKQKTNLVFKRIKHLSPIEGTKAKRQDQHKYLTSSPPKPEVYTKSLYSVRAKNKSTAQKLYE